MPETSSVELPHTTRDAGASRKPSSAAEEERRPWTPDIDDAGAGYDTFGANADWARRVAILNSFLYDKWFRVRSHGAQHIPQRGAGILVANHSGSFPLDGAMIWTDVLRRTQPPRLVRPIAHYVVPAMPVFSTFAARMGIVSGTRGNVERLLSRGELLLIFPEGVPGIIKGFGERYKLRDFTVGHAEFAIRHRVPIHPVAVIGAEEQWPALGTIPFGRSRLKRVAVPMLPFPLPVRYHLHYGPPIRIYEDHPPESADVPEVLDACAERVRGVVQSMVDEGLRQRKGVFT